MTKYPFTLTALWILLNGAVTLSSWMSLVWVINASKGVKPLEMRLFTILTSLIFLIGTVAIPAQNTLNKFFGFNSNLPIIIGFAILTLTIAYTLYKERIETKNETHCAKRN